MGGLWGGAKGMLASSQIIAPPTPPTGLAAPLFLRICHVIFKFSMRFISLQKCFSLDRLLPRKGGSEGGH